MSQSELMEIDEAPMSEEIHSDEQIEVNAMVEGFLSGWENVKPNLTYVNTHADLHLLNA